MGGPRLRGGFVNRNYRIVYPTRTLTLITYADPGIEFTQGVSLYGDAGNDTIYGGNGNDRLYAGSGHTVLHGGTGHDRLIGHDRSTFYSQGDEGGLSVLHP